MFIYLIGSLFGCAKLLKLEQHANNFSEHVYQHKKERKKREKRRAKAQKQLEANKTFQKKSKERSKILAKYTDLKVELPVRKNEKMSSESESHASPVNTNNQETAINHSP